MADFLSRLASRWFGVCGARLRKTGRMCLLPVGHGGRHKTRMGHWTCEW